MAEPISPKECEHRWPRHVVRKYGREAPFANSGTCARCGVNVAEGGLAVAFSDADVWNPEETP